MANRNILIVPAHGDETNYGSNEFTIQTESSPGVYRSHQIIYPVVASSERRVDPGAAVKSALVMGPVDNTARTRPDKEGPRI